jgi:hypothetical protein
MSKREEDFGSAVRAHVAERRNAAAHAVDKTRFIDMLLRLRRLLPIFR